MLNLPPYGARYNPFLSLFIGHTDSLVANREEKTLTVIL